MKRTENSQKINIEQLDVVDSTSVHARRLIDAGAFGKAPRLFVALEQTGGVGRFGRAWASPLGGVWLTLGWPVTELAPAVLDGLGLRIGLALLHAVDNAFCQDRNSCRANSCTAVNKGFRGIQPYDRLA